MECFFYYIFLCDLSYDLPVQFYTANIIVVWFLQGACVLAGYLKLLPLFIMVLPGMAARSVVARTRGTDERTDERKQESSKKQAKKLILLEFCFLMKLDARILIYVRYDEVG